MSGGRYVQIPIWVLDSPDLSATDIRVFGILAGHADQYGICFPGITAIADRIRASVATVNRSLSALRKAGAVASTRTPRGNRYRVAMAHEGPMRCVTSDTTDVSPVIHPKELEPENENQLTTDPPTPRPSVAASAADAAAAEPDQGDVIAFPGTEQPMTAKPTIDDVPLELDIPGVLPSLPARRTVMLDEAFAAFWAMYPRKVEKGKARAAFARAVTRGADPVAIVVGIRAQAGALASRPKQYQPHPTTWLNGERWADDPAEYQQTRDPAARMVNPFCDPALIAWAQQEDAREELGRRTVAGEVVPDPWSASVVLGEVAGGGW